MGVPHRVCGLQLECGLYAPVSVRATDDAACIVCGWRPRSSRRPAFFCSAAGVAQAPTELTMLVLEPPLPAEQSLGYQFAYFCISGLFQSTIAWRLPTRLQLSLVRAAERTPSTMSASSAPTPDVVLHVYHLVMATVHEGVARLRHMALTNTSTNC